MKQQQGNLFVLKAAVKLLPVSMRRHIFPQEACNACFIIGIHVCCLLCQWMVCPAYLHMSHKWDNEYAESQLRMQIQFTKGRIKKYFKMINLNNG
jgi:hypothetical protein